MTEQKAQDWHNLLIEDVLSRLGTNAGHGLTNAEAVKRLSQFGANALPEAKRRSLLSLFFNQFLSPLIYLLLVAAAVAAYIGNGRDALVILIVVLFNAIIGSFQEGRAELSLAALRRLSTLKARVLRNAHEQIITASEVVPGDILLLNTGDIIPADARLIDAFMLAVAESALTGESMPVTKLIAPLAQNTALADRQNIVYAGTHMTSGRGLAVVIATGTANEIGKIAKMASSTIHPKTQLELRIQQFGRYLVISALIIFSLVIAIGLLRGIAFDQIFMIAVSQMVSLVPEGLPVAMTVALAVGVQRMAGRSTIVRQLNAVETLGATTVICTDKTGTLTRNEMTAVTVYFPQDHRQIKVSGVGYSPNGNFTENAKTVSPLSDKSFQQLFNACVLCNDSQLLLPDSSNTQWRILGDPTEAALLTLACKGGVDLATVRNSFPRKAELPFNPDIKMMATQHDTSEGPIVFIKGAPEAMLSLCDSSNCDTEDIQNAAKQMAEDSLRVLALGFIRESYIDGSKGFSPFKNKLTILGLVGELDPPREEVAAAVSDCQKAGIRPVMVTGDHKSTGLAIARALGISQQNSLAVDGNELDKMSEAELSEKLPLISVFARVHPAQKLRIVEAYQKSGEVVAMTGDGVNDAPALVRANVGVAMGITGTEVAKDAAKIIIADDNFATIVAAISEGRLVYQNIKKLILFLFVTSIDEVIILFMALVFGYLPPLAAVQILWLNLVAEGTLTVNLIMEPHEGDEMQRPPIPVNEPLLDRALLSRIPLMVLASVTSTFGWFVYQTSMGAPAEQVQTETFTVLVLCQWFNVLNCRSAKRSIFKNDMLRNPWLLGGLALSVILHLAVIYWPPLNKFFHTVPIEALQFLKIAIVASFVLWIEEFRKIIVRRKSR